MMFSFVLGEIVGIEWRSEMFKCATKAWWDAMRDDISTTAGPSKVVAPLHFISNGWPLYEVIPWRSFWEK